jgi:hypothetical protein
MAGPAPVPVRLLLQAVAGQLCSTTCHTPSSGTVNRIMRFRTYVEPPEPMRGLELPPEVVEALGGGARPPVTITVNGHTWKSRVAIMRGRRSRSNSTPRPGSSSSRRTSWRPLTPIRSPARDMTGLPPAGSASFYVPSRAPRNRKRGNGASRRPSPPCGADQFHRPPGTRKCRRKCVQGAGEEPASDG